ncbi:MHYT domain-containing protein [Nocardia sp. NPDC052566]|uniref:MHYT domain-containing protein n=1 Tax=Nocardia sp. NPDC052566 TaxID=3364330 RepID=UPI0037C69D9C
MHEAQLLALGDARVEQFSMGVWLAALSFGISVLGAVVGLACVLHGARSARFRLVWVASAAVSVGGVGIWLAMSVALLGLKVSGTALRYDTNMLITSMVVAFVGVFAGLVLIGRTRRLPWLLAGGLVMGLGAGGSIYLGITSVQVQGSVEVTLWLAAVAAVVAVLTAIGTLWSFQTFRTQLARGVTILLFAVGVAATYYLTVFALETSVDASVKTPGGLALFDFVFPMFVVGSLALTVPISAVLIAPDRRDSAPVLPTSRRSGLGATR